MHREIQMGSNLQAYSVTTQDSFRNTSFERMNITRRVCIFLYELTLENQLQMNDTHQAICDFIPLVSLSFLKLIFWKFYFLKLSTMTDQ